jgi:Asp/Glu/hydantoin racemase
VSESQTILVVNPNSSEAITAQIRDAVSAVDDDVVVITSTGGPPAIESDDDVFAAVSPMVEVMEDHGAAAYVVACFADPGLDYVREVVDAPAFGINQSAIHTAMEMGRGVGIISSVADSLPRHARYWEKLGVDNRIVADVALGLGVLELETPEAYEAALAAGRSLLEAGADVIVLGCTGMTHMEARLRDELGVPVVDPCRAAVETARRALQEAQ